MYLSWATFLEGSSDSQYFNILIPRFLELILNEEGIRPYDVGLDPAIEFSLDTRNFDEAAQSICNRSQEFHILIVHADAGGRNLEAGIEQRREALVDRAVNLCGFDRRCAVFLSPRKELEAWALADEAALLRAFGVIRVPNGICLPRRVEVEQVADPKSTLQNFARLVGARRNNSTFIRIAQEQDFTFLRELSSFQEFETSLRAALRHQGCI